MDGAGRPGGVASVGAGLGAGMAIAGQMADPNVRPVPGRAPPLPADGPQFYVGIRGSQAGPFDLVTLPAKVWSGEITGRTLVWRAGTAAWAAPDAVDDLRPLFAHLPPPLPPA